MNGCPGVFAGQPPPAGEDHRVPRRCGGRAAGRGAGLRGAADRGELQRLQYDELPPQAERGHRAEAHQLQAFPAGKGVGGGGWSAKVSGRYCCLYQCLTIVSLGENEN